MLHLLKQQISLPIAQACSSYLKNYINAAWTEVRLNSTPLSQRSFFARAPSPS